MALHASDEYWNQSNLLAATSLWDAAEKRALQAMRLDEQMTWSTSGSPDESALGVLFDVLLERSLVAIQGHRALAEGEHALESGSYEQAASHLATAVARFEREQELSATAVEQLEEEPDASFVHVARALTHRLATEQALLTGALGEAAASERERARALRAAATDHAGLANAASEFFSLRHRRDEHFAHERAQLFEAAAARTSDAPPIAATLGFVAIVAALLGGVFAFAGDLAVLTNPVVFVFLLVFAMVVAAVGVRLTSYSDGERTITALARAARETAGAGGSSATGARPAPGTDD
jgi:hypothetical protein